MIDLSLDHTGNTATGRAVTLHFAEAELRMRLAKKRGSWSSAASTRSSFSRRKATII